MLDETGSDFAVGAYVRLRPDGAGGYSAGEVQPWVAAATAPERRGTTIDEHPEASGNIVAWSKVSRTDFWHRAGIRFPEGRLYEDQVVAQQMYARARRFDTVPDVVAHWRVRADGSSITQREAHARRAARLPRRDGRGPARARIRGPPARRPRRASARSCAWTSRGSPRSPGLHPDAAYRRAARRLHPRRSGRRRREQPALREAVASAVRRRRRGPRRLWSEPPAGQGGNPQRGGRRGRRSSGEPLRRSRSVRGRERRAGAARCPSAGARREARGTGSARDVDRVGRARRVGGKGGRRLGRLDLEDARGGELLRGQLGVEPVRRDERSRGCRTRRCARHRRRG